MAPGTVFVLTYELDFGSGTRQVAAIRSDLPDGDGFDSLLSVIPNGTIMTLVPPPEKHLGDNPKKRRRSGGRTHQTNEDDILCSQLKQFIGMTVRHLFIATAWGRVVRLFHIHATCAT
jgi:hypothetical protein